MADTRVLSRRALGRATLARQLLLERARGIGVEALVEHLVGLQAQEPHSWYVGFWSRLEGFRAEAAGELLAGRALVRIALMRSTIHLVTAADCRALRPLVQPVIERSMTTNHGRFLDGVGREELIAAAGPLLGERPLTFRALNDGLAARWPGRDRAAMGQAVRAWLPLVQVPPRGVWGRSGPVAHTTVEAWLGPADGPPPSLAAMILRYLRAFGPATVADVQVWSGLTRLREAVDALRPELVTFRDEDGRELFDLPDAPRPDPATPAPPRFLYDFDNVLLSHRDRARVVTDEHRAQPYGPEHSYPAAFLIDGMTAGQWRVIRDKDRATLLIRPYLPLAAGDERALGEEGAGLLGFVAPGADPDVVVRPPGGEPL